MMIRALAWWLFTWYSLGLSFAFLSPGFPSGLFLTTNFIPDVFRERLASLLLKLLAVGFFSFGTFFLWHWRKGRGSGESLERFERVLRFTRPLSLLWVFSGLLHGRFWDSNPSLAFSLAFGTAVVFSRLLWPAEVCPGCGEGDAGKRFEVSPRIDWLILGFLFIAFTGYTSLGAIRNHYALGTSDYDLGIVENFLWNSTQGNWFESPLEGKSHMAVHISYLYFFVLPFYALIPRTETLIIMQAAVLGAAVFPLYAISRKLSGSRIAGLILSCLYIVHPSIGGSAFWDFHELKFFPLLFLFLFWAYQESRLRTMCFAVFLFLGIKEDSGLLLVVLAFIAFLEGRNKAGLALLGTGTFAYVICAKVLIPFFGGSSSEFSKYFGDLILAGKGPEGFMETIILNPLYSLEKVVTAKKVLFFIQVFSPLAFACFLSLEGWILVSYGAGLSFLATWYPLFELGFQYILQGLAPAFIGFSYSLRGMPSLNRRRLLTVAIIMSFFSCLHYGMFSADRNFKAGFKMVDLDFTSHSDEYWEMMGLGERIPPQASLTASQMAVPHFCRRRQIYALRLTGRADSMLMFGRGKKKPGTESEFFLVHRDDVASGLFGQVSPDGFDRDYTRIASGTWFALFSRNPSSK